MRNASSEWSVYLHFSIYLLFRVLKVEKRYLVYPIQRMHGGSEVVGIRLFAQRGYLSETFQNQYLYSRST